MPRPHPTRCAGTRASRSPPPTGAPSSPSRLRAPRRGPSATATFARCKPAPPAAIPGGWWIRRGCTAAPSAVRRPALNLDLAAPIIPGVGAAGVVLGEALPAPLAAAAFAVERIGLGSVRYSFDAVRVSTRYGLVSAIDLSAGYTGTIGGRVGIGSSVAEVEAAGRGAGWSFETTPRAAGEPPLPPGAARVSLIS